MSKRPVRTTAQIAAAVGCPLSRADELLRELARRRLVEPHQGGWRATRFAWTFYPRPHAWEQKAA